MQDYSLQTSWLPLIDKVMADDLSLQNMLHGYSSRLVKFILNIRGNTLASPDNLSRWNLHGYAKSGLCNSETVTAAHIMNLCPWVRKQNSVGRLDRYAWRQNNVLRILVNHISQFISNRKRNAISDPVNKQIQFCQKWLDEKIIILTACFFWTIGQSKGLAAMF